MSRPARPHPTGWGGADPGGGNPADALPRRVGTRRGSGRRHSWDDDVANVDGLEPAAAGGERPAAGGPRRRGRVSGPARDRLARMLMREPFPRWEVPVLAREMRARMRRGRTFTVVAAYAGFHSLVALSVYWHAETGIWSRGQVVGPAGSAVSEHLARMGRELWLAGMLPQSFILPLIAAGLTCGAITVERERGLLDHLFLTRLSATQVALGKLLAGTGICLLLLLSTVPALSLCFLLGGVEPRQIALTIALVCSAVLAAGALGLAISAVARRTAVATAVTFAVLSTVLLGLPVLAWTTGRVFSLAQQEASIAALLLSLTTAALLPAVAAGMLLERLPVIRPVPPGPAQRTRRVALIGLCWAAMAGLMHLPGAQALLLIGERVAELHPGLAVMELMGNMTISQMWRPPPELVIAVTLVLGVWLTTLAVVCLKTVRG